MRDPVHQQTLDNGLRVVWEEDHRQPLVAIEARIIGGLREEGPYLGMGITHFLEHMLFKGTTTRAPGTIDQEVRRYGGSINAFTSHDHTGVTLYVESRYVREALAMLSDILQHAVFPEEEFQKERVVVISEIQMNRDDPERRISDLFWSHLFLVHPYRHPILGYLEQLKKLTAKDMATYYHSQYLPNNVVLACAGDIDSSTFPKIVQETFGTWERGVPYQQLVQTEPPTLSPREAIDELPVQAAYMTLGFPSTRLADPNLYALDVLAGILGQGRSSRLYEELVRKRQVAQIAAAANYTPFDPGAFTVYLRTEPSQAQAAIDATYEVIEAIKRDGVSAAELTKARRQVEADYLFRHQTIESVAEDLASSLAMTGDPAFSKGYVAGVDRVTADDVKRVANQYLVRTAATLAIIRPPAKAETTAPPTEERPNVTKTVLPNGLTVLIGVDRHLPLASIVVGGHGGRRVVREAKRRLGRLDALVNSAADFFPTPLPKLSERDWDRHLDLNLKGSFFCAQEAARVMRRGSIVQILDANKIWKRYAAYGISKAGAAAMVDVLRRALSPRIHVHAVAPGHIRFPGERMGIPAGQVAQAVVGLLGR